MENNVVKKRGFLGGWDAIVIVGVLLLGFNTLDNYLYNKNDLKKKAMDLEIEKEKTKQAEINKQNNNSKKIN